MRQKNALSTREVELTETIIRTSRRQKLSITDTNQVSEGAKTDSTDVVEKLKEERAALYASRKVLEGFSTTYGLDKRLP